MLFSAALDLATKLPFVDYLFPEQAALQDFEFTDFIFAKRGADTTRNKTITIVNLGNLNRTAIARLIDSLNVYEPAVIGIDAFFNCEKRYANDTANCITLKDPVGSRLLSEAIRKTKKCVLASRLLVREGQTNIDSLEFSDPMFANYAKHGFVNFPVTLNSVIVLRDFWPMSHGPKIEELAFAVEVAREYDSIATKKFLSRNKPEEMINYSGHAYFSDPDEEVHGGKFTGYNWEDIFSKNFKPDAIRNRIIVIGFYGESYFSPLNTKPLGRAYPDAPGIVIHANIIASVLDNKPINMLGRIGELIFALVMCTIHVRVLLWIKAKTPKWYDFIAIALIIAMLGLAALIRIELFTLMNVKSNLTLTLTSLALSGIAISIFENLETWWKSR